MLSQMEIFEKFYYNEDFSKKLRKKSEKNSTKIEIFEIVTKITIFLVLSNNKTT